MVNFKSATWERKGFLYFLKDTLRNRPQMVVVAAVLGIVIPIQLYYIWLTDEQRQLEMSRFRKKYVVLREDDPRVKKIIKFDENGNRVYLQPKTE